MSSGRLGALNSILVHGHFRDAGNIMTSDNDEAHLRTCFGAVENRMTSINRVEVP